MSNNLTDRTFWKNFWESKKGLIFKVKPDYTFSAILGKLIKERNLKTAIELGGFPGYYSTFLKRYFDLKVTLFDYFIHQKIIDELLVFNDLKTEDIEIIEADLFTYQPKEKYDLVSSFGLIEHFENTKDIIEKHLMFLNNNGTLFITLPNFKGVNGWVQKKFDKYNYDKHNINCMDLNLLKSVAEELGLKEVKTYYTGGFSTWLENKASKPAMDKAIVKTIWLAGKIVSKTIKKESKLLSPYIVLEARR
ncbi:class I SAM-dependent methyltransferase [Pedobacter sp. SD-b]|uniref:Class I SAM-dependent methyltransferase n=1 Tax=Pedobacter segetis TaxID=2793069 RepID=A0ABS1BHB9_9SPHI|nr:class I SAM-dependent methyltransferase [Pedobacter segetis]MBK0382253.1 class I SAM-dependent methyltransferase [Pedobacter segetis]